MFFILRNSISKGETARFYAENAGFERIVQMIKRIEKGKKDLITHSSVRLDNYREIVTLMKLPDSGVPLSDQKNFFITHNNCFAGSELVDWILKNLAIRTREEAVEFSQKLLDAHWIAGINKKKKFKDADSTLYRFSTGTAPNESETKVDSIGLEDFEQLKVLGKGAFGKVCRYNTIMVMIFRSYWCVKKIIRKSTP